MARTQLKHGVTIETVTRQEVEDLLRQYTTRQQSRERVRAPAAIRLDATGLGQAEVFSVPTGFECEVRRVFFDLSLVTSTTFSATAIALNGAGVSAEYLRSGTRIEWAAPSSPNGITVPGIQTWGSEQGPYLRNGETFEVRASLGAPAANAILLVLMEGVLTKGGSLK